MQCAHLQARAHFAKADVRGTPALLTAEADHLRGHINGFLEAVHANLLIGTVDSRGVGLGDRYTVEAVVIVCQVYVMAGIRGAIE